MLQSIKSFFTRVYVVMSDIQMKRAENYIKYQSKEY